MKNKTRLAFLMLLLVNSLIAYGSNEHKPGRIVKFVVGDKESKVTVSGNTSISNLLDKVPGIPFSLDIGRRMFYFNGQEIKAPVWAPIGDVIYGIVQKNGNDKCIRIRVGGLKE